MSKNTTNKPKKSDEKVICLSADIFWSLFF